MKKIFAIILACAMLLSMAACTQEPPVETPPENPPAETPAGTDPVAEQPDATEADVDEKGEGVMSYAEYAAAPLDTEVTIETYVQATQSWWDGKITAYTQDKDGAYFIYNMACSEEDAAKLVPGTKIKVTGYKAEWSGEIEIIDATFEFLSGSYIAEPRDLTEYLGSEELINFQNLFMCFNGLSIEPIADANGEESAFLYNWDGSGSEGNDLYFNASYMGAIYTFTVESYLCGSGTPVYEAVKTLNVGDNVDITGFLYWYEGVNPHVTGVMISPEVKSEGVMTHAEYITAEFDTPVVIETYVQATQSWWDGKITAYTQDKDGAYFIYNMACAEEDAAKLVPGAKIRVSGYKSVWSGEVEIIDGSFELLDGFYIAPARDLTALLGSEEIEAHQNEKMIFRGLTVVPSTAPDGSEVAFLYNWDGSGSEGNDLYFNVSDGTNTYTFTVESYLCGSGTPAYETVKALNIGDMIDVEGFLYWYEGLNPHVTGVTVL